MEFVRGIGRLAACSADGPLRRFGIVILAKLAFLGTIPDMKITIERAALLRALSHVQSVVERRNTIPILSNILLRAENGRYLSLSATDMDL